MDESSLRSVYQVRSYDLELDSWDVLYNHTDLENSFLHKGTAKTIQGLLGLQKTTSV